MAYEMKPGQGSAFKNEKKTEDWHPPFTGKIMLPDGAIHYFDVTNRKTAAGETFVTARIGKQISPPAGVSPVTPHSAAKANAYVADPDSDIPW